MLFPFENVTTRIRNGTSLSSQLGYSKKQGGSQDSESRTETPRNLQTQVTLRNSSLQSQKANRKLDHPFIIKTFGSTSFQKKIALVLEFFDGIPLNNYLFDQQIFSDFQKTEIAQNICKGMDYLHKKEMIHRDLEVSSTPINSRFSSLSVAFSHLGNKRECERFLEIDFDRRFEVQKN